MTAGEYGGLLTARLKARRRLTGFTGSGDSSLQERQAGTGTDWGSGSGGKVQSSSDDLEQEVLSCGR